LQSDKGSVQGKKVARGEAERADYIFYFKPGIPIAVVEAKDNNHSVGAGMHQVLHELEMRLYAA
jgi:type I restriction enzyme, R subunit